ncbi:DoxX family protein [Poriferisphaera sp. WC338]|uniref:DoxX family protein n=1 Tax=Poriferisphaera sp. WC338 TaxID=3425129 RepID=UPI003D8134D1
MVSVLQGIVAVVGRLMLVAIFLMSALGNKIPNFEATTQFMASEGMPMPKLMLAGGIVFLILGGLSILVGFKARIGAAMLIAFLVLATYYFHDFWTIADAQAREMEMIGFMKNLALIGAMTFVFANGAGVWSLDKLLCKSCCKDGKCETKKEEVAA